MTKKNYRMVLVYILIGLLLTGCASIGKGVTEAILENKESEDTRVCEVWGDNFRGIKPHLNNPEGRMKVLMVHGVGDHKPGYATEFFEKLAKELKLTVTTRAHKNLHLTDPVNPDKDLGNLRVSRYLNASKTSEVLFYELTWSKITAPEKAILAYDNSGEFSFRRAAVNDLMKQFSNDTGPDPIIYLGKSRKDILTAFTQSFCWMIYGNWDELSENQSVCSLPDVSSIIHDEYAFVSHSLGSRITIDGVERITEAVSEKNFEDNYYKKIVSQELKKKTIPIYMLSNQLPMLQLGRELPEQAYSKEQYCDSLGSHYSERMLSKAPIIAFSDPNDLLSYAIPPGFVEKYLDARLCIDVTNVNINVAHVFDIFGIGEVANPMEAHIGYDTDDRVVALIAKGIGNENTAEIVKENCRWIETID